MKFWAKVKFNEEKEVEHLIRAFFKEFNPESSMVIKGKEATVEIVFEENPPMELIEAISHCDVSDFNFGKAFGVYSQEVREEKESAEQTEQVVAKEETLQQTEQPKKKRGRPTTKKAEPTKVVKLANIPPLEEIAKKATSFAHFVRLVAEWLEVGKNQEFFVNLVTFSTEIEKVCWIELEKAFKAEGTQYRLADKMSIAQKVSEKLTDYSVTIIPFLKAMRQYKNYSFGHEQFEENSTEQRTEDNVIEPECIHEIPHFEEIIGSVDKTQPIEERVRYVLTAMGWQEKSPLEQQIIFEMANIAVRISEISFDNIFSKADIATELPVAAKMIFSEFINTFLDKYESNKRLKVLDFLKQLQNMVTCEGEILCFN